MNILEKLFGKKTEKPDPQEEAFRERAHALNERRREFFTEYDAFEDDSLDECRNETGFNWWLLKEGADLNEGLKVMKEILDFRKEGVRGAWIGSFIESGNMIIITSGVKEKYTEEEWKEICSFCSDQEIRLVYALEPSKFENAVTAEIYKLHIVTYPGMADDAATYGDVRMKTEKPQEEKEDLSDRMTGSLVAAYKKTHDKTYSEEYVRRLMKTGFSEPQANNMFLFELMILKSVSVNALADKDYIYRPYYDLSHPVLTAGDDWYIEHQYFLISELVKLWDEAEYIWQNERSRLEDNPNRQRIFEITRYGGGNLFVSYLTMAAEKTGTDPELIRKYSMAEQDLLYIYRWKTPGITHPYK